MSVTQQVLLGGYVSGSTALATLLLSSIDELAADELFSLSGDQTGEAFVLSGDQGG